MEFCTKNSIWSSFTRAKYEDPIHILAHPASAMETNSHTWSCMLSVIDDIEPHIGVCFRSGNSSFLCENLTHEGKILDHALVPISSNDLTIRDIACQDSWNIPLLQSLVCPSHIDTILFISPCFFLGTDWYIWMLELLGNFSLRSAVQLFKPRLSFSFAPPYRMEIFLLNSSYLCRS